MNDNIASDSRKRLRQSSTDEYVIVDAARTILNKESGSNLTEDRRFREMFGCSARVVLQLWIMINNNVVIKGSPKIAHLLWALMFLKLYSKETVTSRLAGGVDEKTYRKWVWIFVTAIADLEMDVINWEKRFECDRLDDCLVTVDMTDFRINNPKKFDTKWFGHKFKHSALRYEVAVSIQKGDIVWIHGPFPAGEWPDINIFRHCLLSHLSENERVVADQGYIGEAPQYVKCPGSAHCTEEAASMQSNARSRHETMNKRLKQWGCLFQQFRHGRNKHGDVFRAVVVITQLCLQNEPLYDVEYSEDNL